MRKSIATQALGSLAALLLGVGPMLIPAEALARNGQCGNSQSQSYADPDQDGLTNAEEDLVGTLKCNDDSDGDGVLDGQDNCATIANALQSDTDDDGFGIICDCDYNQDIKVDEEDLAMFKQAFLSVVADSELEVSDPDHPMHYDHNQDGLVNAGDFNVFRDRFREGPMVDTSGDGIPDTVMPGPAEELLYHY